MHEFRMPSLGADMEAGTLVQWLVKPGEEVTRGQVIAVVETQKGAIDVEIWEPGIIDVLAVEPGNKVPVGAVLALLRAQGESPVPHAGATPETREVPKAETVSGAATGAPIAKPQGVQDAGAAETAARARISPSARRLAEELGVDIASVKPAEPGGVVSREDVQLAASGRNTAHVPEGKEKPPDWHAQMRTAIAAAMSRSKREIPHYYLSTDIDLTAVSAWLAVENSKRGVAERILPVVPVMKAVALALHEVPELNGFWAEGTFRASSPVHLGMAIAMHGGGLVAPAIHDAERRHSMN